MEARCQLPEHGRIACSVCHYPQSYGFDTTRTERDGWRITNNPLAWGGREPEVIVLGFSKGPTQAGSLATKSHDAIAYRGGRSAVAKILHHIGLLERPDSCLVDGLVSDQGGQIHFGSLIRCTVERWDEAESSWKGTGGGMLDRFVATEFGSSVARRCVSTFLGRLPEGTRLILMLGLGSKLNYVRTCMKLFAETRSGTWKWINEVAYTDGKVVVVHTEHFASQGALLPNWLSGEEHERGRYGLLAKEAVVASGATLHRETPRGGPRKATEMVDSIAKASTAIRSAAAAGSTVRSGATRSPAGHTIVLTDGAIRNGNLSLNSVRHLIPAGGVGGTNKNDLGRSFKVRFEPGDVHETDIAGDKMTLRCRGAVRDFFVRTDARQGDVVRIVLEDNRTLAITLQRR